MADKETHPIRNGIIAAVTAGILLSFWPTARSLFVSILSWTYGVIKILVKTVVESYEIPGWLILLFIALAVPTLLRVIPVVRKKKEPRIFDLYRRDFLFGAIWEWSYVGERIMNLNCMCPACKGELIYQEHHKSPFITKYDDEPDNIKLICENCGDIRGKLMGNMNFALGTVEREIRRRIRTGEWKKSIEANPLFQSTAKSCG